MARQADPESAKHLQSLGASFGNSAAKLAALQTEFSRRHLSLWQSALSRGSEAKPEPVESGDRRFASAEWRSNPFFDYLRKSYQINARFLADCVEAIDAEPQAKERLRFA